MHITRTALIYLVTRAPNRVPAGSDTGYPSRALEPLRSVLDSSFLNRPRDGEDVHDSRIVGTVEANGRVCRPKRRTGEDFVGLETAQNRPLRLRTGGLGPRAAPPP